MSAPKLLPKWQDIGKEALIVIGGAIVAAVVISQFPAVKEWINKQWGDTPRGL